MIEGRNNVLVGLFVLVGVAALGLLVVLFGRGPTWLFGVKTYTVFVEFRSPTGELQPATGVKQGTQVTVYGKEIGRVSSVEFVDAAMPERGVRVALAINLQFPLSVGSRVKAIEPGLGMGRPPIEIIPGPSDGPDLAPGATIIGTMGGPMESLIPPEIVVTIETTTRQIGEAAAAMTPVLEDMHEMLRTRTVAEVDASGGPPGNLSTAAARLDATLKHFNEVVGDEMLKSDVRAAVENIRIITEDGRATAATIRSAAEDAQGVVKSVGSFVDQGRTSLEKLDGNVDRVTSAALDVLRPTAAAATELQATLHAVNAGEGTIGKLLQDNRLYEALVLTARRLAETVDEARLLILEWQKGRIKVAL